MLKPFSVILACAAILVAACHAPVPEADGAEAAPGTIEARRLESLEAIDADACAAEGGEIRRDGMMGLYYCIVPYEDAGKICSDTSDCLGRCKVSDDVTDFEAAPGEAVGRCEANNSVFGCYGLVERGNARPMLCVD